MLSTESMFHLSNTTPTPQQRLRKGLKKMYKKVDAGFRKATQMVRMRAKVEEEGNVPDIIVRKGIEFVPLETTKRPHNASRTPSPHTSTHQLEVPQLLVTKPSIIHPSPTETRESITVKEVLDTFQPRSTTSTSHRHSQVSALTHTTTNTTIPLKTLLDSIQPRKTSIARASTVSSDTLLHRSSTNGDVTVQDLLNALHPRDSENHVNCFRASCQGSSITLVRSSANGRGTTLESRCTANLDASRVSHVSKDKIRLETEHSQYIINMVREFWDERWSGNGRSWVSQSFGKALRKNVSEDGKSLGSDENMFQKNVVKWWW
ncbi:hypothetical protein BC829DRAFT_446116 [Chytridium lagenaria]|nr:hypothetical protein BC829DRAFT_446116 [Chytridium lagenaria]